MQARSRQRLGVLAIAASAGVLTTASAHADPETSDALFRQGHAALVAGDYARACDLLQRSLAEDPSATGTLINLAYCHQLTGKNWQAYREYAEALQKPLSAERRAFADRSLRQVDRKLPHVQLQTRDKDGALGLRIEHDDGFIVADAAAPFPVAPGRRTLVLVAPARTPRSVTFEAPNQGGVVIVVVAPAEENEAIEVSPPTTASTVNGRTPGSASPEPATPPTPGPPPEPALRGGFSPALGWASVGIGVAAVGIGSYLGFRSFAIRDDACPTTACDRAGLDRIEGSATTNATLSTVAFVVGIAALAFGTWALLHPPRRTR